jgi:gliding motility-associated-like protein
MLQNLSEGEYAVTVTDAHGCQDTAAASVSEPQSLGIALRSKNVTCYGDENGRIQIDSVWGGTPPYDFSINGHAMPSREMMMPNLAAGNYSIDLIDSKDCWLQTEAVISEPPAIMLDLGEDVYVELGETVDIRPILNLLPTSLASLAWTPAICENCLDTVIMPLENMNLRLTVIDTQGCTATATQKIVVKKDRSVYVPTAFSPNNDGVNDFFMVFAGANVQQIKSFEVFNRWGGKVFSANAFPPNDYTFGWDGKFRGKPLNDNVFTWSLIVDYIDGKSELLTGDVVVMK